MAFLIVGLGNIGPEYANTRHNIGFNVLNAWAEAAKARFTNARYGAITEVLFKGKRFMLLKPSTYVNLSGKAVNYWLQAERFEREELLVVVDDLALPFGALRMRKQGSDGGHNGLKNINESIGYQQYARLRVGIGNTFVQGQQVDYVLSEWSDEEQKALPAVLNRAIDAIKAFGLAGIDRAMNTFNTPATVVAHAQSTTLS
ncbi:MAG: aminoacyl-tRNA hydrolase [Prevotellaceae bacterium]|jgi:PTH1 family peptidyl-tRNA hydrolase|nr:aminoacyl-tRNA hydrolase [Prevotellaceae bacterium]